MTFDKLFTMLLCTKTQDHPQALGDSPFRPGMSSSVIVLFTASAWPFSPSLQEQLCRLFPRLKVLAFGAKPESTLHTYFPSFLSRATPSCPAEMKKEVRNLALPQVQLQAASAVDFPCSLQLAPTAICPTQLCFNTAWA